MRLSCTAIALTGLAALLAAPARSADTVRSLSVRRVSLPLRGTSPVRNVTGASRIDVRMPLDETLYAFDPRAETVAFSIAGSQLFRSVPGDVTGRWRGRRGVWKWKAKRSGRGRAAPAAKVRVTLDLRPASGKFACDAADADLGVLVVTGPEDAQFTLRLGDVQFTEQQDLGTFGRRWHFPLGAADYVEGPAGPPDPPPVIPPPQGSLAMTPLGSGVTRGFASDQFLVVRDPSEWAALWRVATDGEDPLPEVDLGTDMVLFVAIAGPGRNWIPYPTTIGSVIGSGSVLYVNVNTPEPGRTCRPEVMADPAKRAYVFVSVPRSYAIPIFKDEGWFPCD